jgi:sugar lactone lactonase YvrE
VGGSDLARRAVETPSNHVGIHLQTPVSGAHFSPDTTCTPFAHMAPRSRFIISTCALALASSAPAPTGVLAQDVIVVDGFSASEAVRHDPMADVYLVANINGDATDADDNGFISRVSPEGEILELKWIDGATGDFTLNAPKGMTFMFNLLLVADIDHVRVFNRTNGAHMADWPIPGAVFLNDIAVGPNGALYVTDTGTNTLYRFDDGTPVVVASGEEFGNPNGVDVDAEGPVVVLWRGGVKRVDPLTGETTDLPAPGGGQLDGIVLMDDGSYVVSSWSAEAVLRVAADGTITPVLESVPQAADIGYDATRNRILVPTFMNQLHIVSLAR